MYWCTELKLRAEPAYSVGQAAGPHTVSSRAFRGISGRIERPEILISNSESRINQAGGKSERRRGAVVLMVLGFVVLASWMLIQILQCVHTETALRGVEHQNDAIRAAAFQALEITIGVLAEVRELDGALYGPAQGWDDILGYAGFPATARTNVLEEASSDLGVASPLGEVAAFAFPTGIEVEVSIRDESGRLPLNHTSGERWKLLFEAMEIQAADASTLTDCLLDWIDPDDEPRLNGAEGELYQQRAPPYEPLNGPIEDLYQLRLVEGFDRLFFDDRGVPNDLFQTFAACVTTVSAGPVNYNTAPALVLDVLAEEADFEAQRVVDFRNGVDLEPGTEDDRVLRPGLDETEAPVDGDGNPLDFSATCRYFTLHIAARSASTVFRLAARLDTATRPRKGLYPITILELQTRGADL